MTPTAEDLAFALAALDAGVEVIGSAWSCYVAWTIDEDGRKTLATRATPILALAAAGRALKLQPKWVVVDADVATRWLRARRYHSGTPDCDSASDLRLADEALADALSHSKGWR